MNSLFSSCIFIVLIVLYLIDGRRTERQNNIFKGALNTSTLFEDTINSRHVRRAGDQPSEGNCQVFKWGGSSGVHWYACCNNCENNNPNYHPDCDSETYQGGSSISYCDHCGEDKGTGDADKFKNEFKCGGCDGQAAKRKKCKTNLRKLYNVPGFCWAHIRCFKKHCQKSYGRKNGKSKIYLIPALIFNVSQEKPLKTVRLIVVTRTTHLLVHGRITRAWPNVVVNHPVALPLQETF